MGSTCATEYAGPGTTGAIEANFFYRFLIDSSDTFPGHGVSFLSMTELEEQLARVSRDLKEAREENRLLRQKLDIVLRRMFGAKSEQLDPAQLELLLSDPGEAPGKAPAPAIVVAELVGAESVAKKPRPPRRPRMPEDLPVIEEVIQPAPVEACPDAWRRIGEEVSEQLDYEPGRFLCRRTIRPKYVKYAEPELAPVIAPLPPRLQDRGLYAPGLLTHIVIGKYADHLPLYRQEQIFKQRYGVDLPRQSLCRAVEMVADWLKPIVAEMQREMFTRGYLQIDETPIKYLDPGRGKAAQGYLWACHEPGGDTVYHWYAGRGQNCLKDLMPENFSGWLQCDAYPVYQAFARKHDDIELAGCWAHARRYFKEALDRGEATMRTAWVLRQIAQLYRIEEGLRKSRAGPALREAIRQSESRPIILRLRRAFDRFQQSHRHPPQSLLGKAINYALSFWQPLCAWLDDGRIEIDNNLVENAIRPTALGKKNWMFFGAEGAGWRSAVIYSIMTSCRGRGIDPYAYLKDVLERLPAMTNHQIPSITPAAWAAEQMQSTKLAS
jgi:transposase